MRGEGIPTPEITFLSNTNNGLIMNQLFDQFYSKGLYEELWFYWDGKPLIMGNFNDPDLLEVVHPEKGVYYLKLNGNGFQSGKKVIIQ